VNSALDIINWALLFFSLSGMALMLRALSRRLGEALHMRKYYYLYDASILIFAASVALEFLGKEMPARWIFLGGAVLMLGTTLRYWGWIFPEIFKTSK
jgi:hypothetical protein